MVIIVYHPLTDWETCFYPSSWLRFGVGKRCTRGTLLLATRGFCNVLPDPRSLVTEPFLVLMLWNGDVCIVHYGLCTLEIPRYIPWYRIPPNCLSSAKTVQKANKACVLNKPRIIFAMNTVVSQSKNPRSRLENSQTRTTHKKCP
jgi:hypothetical protein